MGQITVTLHWNDATEQWRMTNTDSDEFIQEFYDCENINKVFEGLNKTESQVWKLYTERLA